MVYARVLVIKSSVVLTGLKHIMSIIMYDVQVRECYCVSLCITMIHVVSILV